MSFPTSRYESARGFLADYAERLRAGLAGVDGAAVEAAAALLAATVAEGGCVFVAGNGGSAAIADHLACDLGKGSRTGTDLVPRVVPLTGASALVSAVANDIGYEHVYAYQIDALARPGDLVILISSSGNSPNVVLAAERARAAGARVLAMTGFDGGKLRGLADVSLHVADANYGVIEDCHQVFGHVLTQYVRHRAMAPERIAATKF